MTKEFNIAARQRERERASEERIKKLIVIFRLNSIVGVFSLDEYRTSRDHICTSVRRSVPSFSVQEKVVMII